MRARLILIGLIPALFAGCPGGSAPTVSDTPAASVPTAPAINDPAARSWERLQDQLRAVNAEFKPDATDYRDERGEITMLSLDQSGVTEIAPLAGLHLKFLSLKGCPVSDVSAIRGMPIEELALEDTDVSNLGPLSESPLHTVWLNNAPVSDLKPLAGLPITSLNLLGTKVSDVSPLRGMPIESLWLNETQVSDISPLGECPLISLTLHKTPVSDLSVVRRIPSLQRLHIGETNVSDLRPLAGLRLTRLIFTPGKITQGIDAVRKMDTLQELDVEFREPQRWTPEEFWRHYDAGELR